MSLIKNKNKSIKQLKKIFSLCDSNQVIKFDIFKEIGKYLLKVFTESLPKLKLTKEDLIDCITQTSKFFDSDFVDRNSFLNLATTSQDILSAFIYIINEGYWKDTSISSINNYECFDIMIYTIHGLIEKPDHLNKFVDTLYSIDNGKEEMINFINILGKSINNAISYTSSSYSLEILMILYNFYCYSSKHKNEKIVKIIIDIIPKCLLGDIEKNSFDKLNIREYLHNINKSNKNIISIPIKSLKLSEPTAFHQKVTSKRIIIEDDTWIEFGLYNFSLNINNNNLSLSNSDIINAEFIHSTVSEKHNSNKKYGNEIIKTNSIINTSSIESSDYKHMVIFTMEDIPEKIVDLTNYTSNGIDTMVRI
jgi:hypothetical protein